MNTFFHHDKCFRDCFDVPFTKKGKFIHIPAEYQELFIDDNHFVDLDKILYTEYNMERLFQLYVSSFWMEVWYDDSLPTPKSLFYPLNEIKEDMVFETNKFVRLNSVSPKYYCPVKSLTKALEIVIKSERCQNAVQNSIKYNLPKPQLVMREWVDLSMGNEYRCFVYHDKITAISSNDTKISDLDNISIINRCQKILKKVLHCLPFHNCIMDVYLAPDASNDLLIEFNSFGTFANAGAGFFHWIEDYAIIHNTYNDDVVVRTA